MKEPKDEFLEHIKNTLLGHEEPYDEGAWERFAANNAGMNQKPAPVIPIWKWAAVAAAVLIGAVLLLKYLNAPDTAKHNDLPIAVITPATNTHTDSIVRPTDTTGHVLVIPKHQKSNVTSEPLNAPSPFVQNILNPQPPTIQPQQSIKNIPQEPAFVQQQSRPAETQQEHKPINKPFWENRIEEQIADNKITQPGNPLNNTIVSSRSGQKQTDAAKSTKWLSSLYISPNFGNDGVNMGYGYSLGYAVNDKIRISSGIAYTKVSSSRSYDAQELPATATMNAMTTDLTSNYTVRTAGLSGANATTYLRSVDSWVAGIDVPLEISYDISKKIYTTGGVSGLFVLNGKDTRTYVDNMNSRATVTTSQGKVKEYSNLSDESAPVSEQTPNKATGFLGFYNVSAGFKQKISDKNAVSLEPFVKVPMKKVSDQKLNYTGVGIRLKFDF